MLKRSSTLDESLDPKRGRPDSAGAGHGLDIKGEHLKYDLRQQTVGIQTINLIDTVRQRL